MKYGVHAVLDGNGSSEIRGWHEEPGGTNPVSNVDLHPQQPPAQPNPDKKNG